MDLSAAASPAPAVVTVDRSAAREEAFRLLMTEGLPRVHGLAAQILGSTVEAEDAVHDAAILAWRRFGSLRDLERFSVWFDRILINTCRDRLRSRSRARVVSLSPAIDASPVVDPDGRGLDPARGIEQRQTVDAALRTLSIDQQVVLALRFGADLTVPAIAARLAVPEGTVKTRLHHGLRALRAELDAEDRR